MSFELLGSETVFEGRAFAIRRDRLRLPGGRETRLEIVEHIGSVVILPVDAEGNLIFVRQYRHATGMDLLELPAGTLNGDEPRPVCAARETREETGMGARTLTHIGDFYLAPGYSTEFMSVFLAADLYEAPLQADEDEILDVVRIPVREAFRMAEEGRIPDAKSLAALFLARPRLEAALK